ncbi:MAG: hypothetical protein ACHQRM_03725 [Bacteroidia bacterium]
MSTDPRISLEFSCPAKWQNMTTVKDGRFCGECSKTVIDFSDKTLDEIKDYIAHAVSVCGHYQARHTTESESKWFTFLNSIETNFSRIRLQRTSMFFITILLFISGCRVRHTTGAYAYYSMKKKDAIPKEQNQKVQATAEKWHSTKGI